MANLSPAEKAMNDNIYDVMLLNEFIICNGTIPKNLKSRFLKKCIDEMRHSIDTPLVSYTELFRVIRLFDYLYLNSAYVQNLPPGNLLHFSSSLLDVFAGFRGTPKAIPSVLKNVPDFMKLVGESVYNAPTIYDFLVTYFNIFDIQSTESFNECLGFALEWSITSDGLPSASCLAIINFVTKQDLSEYITDENSYDITQKFLHNIDPEECVIKNHTDTKLSLRDSNINNYAGNLRTNENPIGKGSYGTVFTVEGHDDIVLKIYGEQYECIKEFTSVVNLKHSCINSVSSLVPNTFDRLIFPRAVTDLHQYVNNRKSMPKILIQSYIAQLVTGLHYCHSNKIAHLDLKPKNIVLYTNGRLQIIDFGAASNFNPYLTHPNLCVTTYIYAPPEILFTDPGYHKIMKEKFQPRPDIEATISYPAVDMWSLGIIFLFLLTLGSAEIFDSDDIRISIKNILETPLDVLAPGMSIDERNFLDGLLQLKPENRLTSLQAMNHPYIASFIATYLSQ